ncbi:MAG: M14 family zinc carboxypeptidase [Bacteroidia bacterium]|jgi:murein tripeptide amidase MpaA|nr:M14 family zinc carboxypeptidase [Bacteroidia bacterium]
MKKISFLFNLFLIISLSVVYSQTQEKYYRIQLLGNPHEIIQRLANKGISIDHAHFSNERIIAEFSESELRLIDQSNVPYEILIEDMAKYYQQRNEEASHQKVQFISNCDQFNFPQPAHFHLGSMGGFFTLNEMYQILDSMALLYPNLISIKQPISNTNSIQGRPIYYVKISDNPSTNEPEPEVLFTALHHSREPASLSQLIFFMWYLLENYTTDPDVQFLINNTEMYFIPCVNPDGYEYNRTTNPNGGGMHRKNRRNNGDGTYGVDLNRNYGYMWGYDNTGSSPNTNSDTYRGTGPFSEPETQAVRDFCISHQFVNALNAHTYSNLYIYPWGYIASFLTPDSITFINWGKHLTREDRFLYGTGDQTVNYVTNGDSDDWMYGDQSSKNKIMSTTPEAGSANDGFWPPSNRIIDICKTTLFQNIHFALLATNYANVNDEQDNFITSSGYLRYSIQRLGITGNGQFTVSILPLNGIASTGSPKSYTLSINQKNIDSIPFTLSTGLTAGQKLKYILAINNGAYTHYDTIQKVYGSPITLIYDNGNSLSNWNTNGWGVTNSSSTSSPSSITDSPSGNYSNNANKYISLKNNLDLTNAVYAHLQYYTKFSTEKNYDFVNIYISTNNGSTWNPLCSKYQTPPSSFGGTTPVYDGKQIDWVKEEIDLTPYVGNNILIKFVLTSDVYGTDDGFYFDDFLVRKIINPTSVNELNTINSDILIYPNPSTDDVNILSNEKINTIYIYDISGKLVDEIKNVDSQNFQYTKQLNSGIYFIRVELKNQNVTNKKFVITK